MKLAVILETLQRECIFFSFDVIRFSSIFFRNTIVNQTDNILLKQHRLYLNNGHSQGDSTHWLLVDCLTTRQSQGNRTIRACSYSFKWSLKPATEITNSSDFFWDNKQLRSLTIFLWTSVQFGLFLGVAPCWSVGKMKVLSTSALATPLPLDVLWDSVNLEPVILTFAVFSPPISTVSSEEMRDGSHGLSRAYTSHTTCPPDPNHS